MIKLTALFFILICLSAYSQPVSDCSNRIIYDGYITGDMALWQKAMAEELDIYKSTGDPCHLFTFIEARYGYIGYLLGVDKQSEARPLVDSFESEIETLSALPQYTAETEAFRAALFGFLMELSPARAISLGPKALRQLEKAMEVGGSSAAVWIEKANSEANMPAFVGGSKAKAAESFREALRIFEADPQLSPSNWRYLDTIVKLGHLLEEMEDYEGARDEYLRALKREPSFLRVRDELLPAVEKKMK